MVYCTNEIRIHTWGKSFPKCLMMPNEQKRKKKSILKSWRNAGHQTKRNRKWLSVTDNNSARKESKCITKQLNQSTSVTFNLWVIKVQATAFYISFSLRWFKVNTEKIKKGKIHSKVCFIFHNSTKENKVPFYDILVLNAKVTVVSAMTGVTLHETLSFLYKNKF